MARPRNNVVWLSKSCGVCKIEKPHSDFYKNAAKGMLKSECKECTTVLQKKYKFNPNSVRVIGSKPVPLEKSCSKCGEVKSYKEFYKGKGRLTSQCKACTDERLKSFHAKNPDAQSKFRSSEYNRSSMYKKAYGLSIEDVRKMHEGQMGLCANRACSLEIFVDVAKGDKRKAFVDHCHSTGKVRGLLCISCNTSLGLLEQKSKVLGLVEYLQKHGKIIF